MFIFVLVTLDRSKLRAVTDTSAMCSAHFKARHIGSITYFGYYVTLT